MQTAFENYNLFWLWANEQLDNARRVLDALECAEIEALFEELEAEREPRPKQKFWTRGVIISMLVIGPGVLPLWWLAKTRR